MKEEEFIAHVRHIGWIGFQVAAGQPWDQEINEDQKESLLDGIKYLKEHPKSTPEENHENWRREKLRQGWKYGQKKDFETKRHPDLVAYDQLPEIEKRKNRGAMIIHEEAKRLWKEIGKEPRKVRKIGKTIAVIVDKDWVGEEVIIIRKAELEGMNKEKE